MRTVKQYRILNIVMVIFLFLAILSFLISYVFDVEFVAKHIDEDGRIGEHVKPRIALFQKQMLYLSIFLGVIGFLLLIFKKKVLNFLNFHPEFLINLATLLIIIGVIFLLGEIIVRVFFSGMIYSEYTDGPGSVEFLNRIKYNSLGYRDIDHSPVKVKDTYRILFLGDSFTFGSGIENLNDIYPKLIQYQLDENNNKNIEAILLLMSLKTLKKRD